MIRSMTAFARQESSSDWGDLSLELRSVNQRHLDVSLRLPEECRVLEPKLREMIGARLSRGKIECSVRFSKADSQQSAFVVNTELASHLSKASREIDALLYSSAPINAMDILRWPGVLQYEEQDMSPVHEALIQTLGKALDDLLAAREREGDKLKNMILQRFDAIDAETTRVKTVLPDIMAKWKEKTQARLDELKTDIDENRLAQELAHIAQKTDIDEELDRIDSHLEEIRCILESDKPVGRRLDFLMQELHREANTLGSKSIDKQTTKASVELKVLIEQAREQVQNIE